MLVGAHTIIYSKDAEADRAFLRDVLSLPNVDVGEGWLIFGLPASEVAVHPSDENEVHEFYFMVDDVRGLMEKMEKHGRACEPAQDMGWGVLTQVMLPGGGKLGFYQPRHARPKSAGATAPAAKAKPAKAVAVRKVAAVRKSAGGRKSAGAAKKARPAAKRATAVRKTKKAGGTKKRRTSRR